MFSAIFHWLHERTEAVRPECVTHSTGIVNTLYTATVNDGDNPLPAPLPPLALDPWRTARTQPKRQISALCLLPSHRTEPAQQISACAYYHLTGINPRGRYPPVLTTISQD
ncbi:hypothetical protein RRG08_061165 [Elysia crispata]|uniref:Uncharacterized protein n=1 Tax=Elysia crispata TaxID=231223 RepID=A0AAE0XDH4_9GAST|nr:hypothetical protein RRG08_061165 [Elysia crispata]